MAPKYHQFDFRIGDWNAFDVDKPSTVVARNRVERILSGCVLLDDYHGTDGSEGQRFSMYDASKRVWHQTWVTKRGKLLVIEGEFQSGEMIVRGGTGRRMVESGAFGASGSRKKTACVRLRLLLSTVARPGNRGSIYFSIAELNDSP